MTTMTAYLMSLLSEIEGVKAPLFIGPHFKEFTVNIDRTGKKFDAVHKQLLSRHAVHGGKNLNEEFPELGQTALYCVTEVHSKAEIDRLAQELRDILGGKR